ncbi:MAG TPA: hypothetical protein VKI62_01870, partial [Bacteroidota bacterium]|nr:hypothetical protein [Bacteroidota bacterium]
MIDEQPARLYSMNEDGGNVHQISNDTEKLAITDAAFSPDGNSIAFQKSTSNGGDYASLLYIMKSDGTDQHLLTQTRGTHLVWSPDGQQLAFTVPFGS